ncbi:MAG TPA: SdrD B-like domain-containing protein, partial [Candidatus Anammoximicrobium sp.]|nr:SdrD B-like domain-containing protein [Candidatus Anammoximicrobium sp.]
NTADPDGGTANQAAVTLASGQINLTTDFGYQDQTNPNTVTGTIWKDADADGTQDGTETGRWAGVTVVLLDAQGDVVATTTTDANGNYTFSGIPDGTYTVDVTDDGNVLNGAWKTSGTAGVDGQSQADPVSVTLTGNGIPANADFGYYKTTAAIGDRVWQDANRNGIQDPFELGLANVPVTLRITYPNGAVTTVVTTTDASGNYSFTNLLADESFDGVGAGEPTYSVSVATPAGYTPTVIGAAGSTPANDSNNPAGAAVTLTQGTANNTIDFGFQGTASIGDTIWVDLNGDGVQQPQEPGIPNVDVTLAIDVNGDSVVDYTVSTTTDANGNFQFNNLVPGTYTVTVDSADLPSNLAANPTADADDPAGATIDTPHTAVVTLTPGQANSAIDFGYRGTASIGDTIFNDLNGDGVFQAGEGLANVDVTLTGDLDGDGVAETLTTSTNASGVYSFVGLPAGTYQITVNTATIVPTGLLPWVDPDGTRDSRTSVTVTTGQSVTTADFGYAAPASISGVVFTDTNGDGSIAGEPATPGVTVYLDLDDNGALDPGEPTQTTNSSGQYTFSNLLPGTYVVRELRPTGTNQTAPTANGGSYSVTVTPGSNSTGWNFGNQPVPPQMLDDRDDGFTIVSGTWQQLYCSAFVESWIHYTCTSGGDSEVQWQFTNLTPGATYRVSTTWLATTSFTSDAPFTVSGGAEDVTLDINQKARPSAYADSFQAGGIWWKDIVSAYTITGTTLTVSLTNATSGGCVQADAVRIIEVTTPEITVLDGGTAMTDGSTTPLDLGGSSEGVTWTRTFTIRNDGGEPLQLGTLTVPYGFSVASAWVPVTLAPGAQTTFVLRFDALQNGVSYTGDIVIGNNDNNEAPFNFPITARVGAGLTPTAQSGSPAPAPTPPPSGFVSPIEMTDLTTSTPLENVFSTVDYGSASSPANVAHQYRIDNPDTSAITVGSIVAPSGFTVSGLTLPATIAAEGSATFSVTLDSATVGSYGGEVLVSAEGGAPLFTFTVSGGVTAGGLPPLTEPLYVDNGDAGYTDTAGFFMKSLAGYQGDYELALGDASGDYAQWEFVGLPGGTFSVAATYRTAYNWTTAAKYTVMIGGTQYGPYSVNQREAPSEIYDQGIGWKELGVFLVPNGSTLTVRLTDEGGGYKVSGDAVRVEQLSPLRAQAWSLDAASATGVTLDAAPTSLVQQAEALWSAVEPQAADRLASVEVIVADLPPGVLGLAAMHGQTVWIDVDANGVGWFIDATPWADEEFEAGIGGQSVGATWASRGGVDLLTVLAHELGHLLGHEDDDDDSDSSLMDFALPPGVRRLTLPAVDLQASAAAGGEDPGSRLVSAPGDDASVVPAGRHRDAAATRADAGLVALLADQPAAWARADEELARLTAAPRKQSADPEQRLDDVLSSVGDWLDPLDEILRDL